MAGLRPIPYNGSASSFASSSHATFSGRLLLLLTLLPLTLAAFAFVLQWRGGGLTDPTTRWSPGHRHDFPGMDIASGSVPARPSPSSSACRVDILARTSSSSFPYYYTTRGFNFSYGSDLGPKICIISSTSAGLEQILPWIFYHNIIGVTTFLMFVEGKAATPNVSKVLESIPGVKVIYRTRELEEQQARSQIWNETWLSGFFYKPCNHELFVKQTLNMEMAIDIARDAGMDWIIHLDTDELIHPAGTGEYSLRQLFSEVDPNIDMVIFPNYESSVERDDVKEPFSEISMFKKNYDHLPKDTYFGNYKDAARGNPNYFLTYGNGKSAARIQDHLRPNGAHRWHNYMKSPNELKLLEAAVLHYTYPKFSDLTSRRDRCGCKPTKEDVKRCFMLEFDRDAFIIASTATEEEMFRWYREHVVWSDKTLKEKLSRKGILTRIYAPMVIVRGLRESGVFSSVIASAQADEFASSKGANPSGAGESKAISSRKIGKKGEAQANARNLLGIENLNPIGPAIPPLSSPGMEDLPVER